jgi:hypothetical protein
MNERIRGLWNRAAESTAAYPSGQNNSWETQVNFMEKFAELVVQECLDTIQRGIDNGGGASEDIVMAGKLALFYSYRNIQYRFGMGDYKDQEHFGVEE